MFYGIFIYFCICCLFFFFFKVFERYKSYSPYDMLESIKKEVKGDLENAFLNLGKHVQPPWCTSAFGQLLKQRNE